MSNKSIDQIRMTLKHLNTRVEKLGRKVDELAFEIRQEFDKVKEMVGRLI